MGAEGAANLGTAVSGAGLNAGLVVGSVGIEAGVNTASFAANVAPSFSVVQQAEQVAADAWNTSESLREAAVLSPLETGLLLSFAQAISRESSAEVQLAEVSSSSDEAIASRVGELATELGLGEIAEDAQAYSVPSDKTGQSEPFVEPGEQNVEALLAEETGEDKESGEQAVENEPVSTDEAQAEGLDGQESINQQEESPTEDKSEEEEPEDESEDRDDEENEDEDQRPHANVYTIDYATNIQRGFALTNAVTQAEGSTSSTEVARRFTSSAAPSSIAQGYDGTIDAIASSIADASPTPTAQISAGMTAILNNSAVSRNGVGVQATSSQVEKVLGYDPRVLNGTPEGGSRTRFASIN